MEEVIRDEENGRLVDLFHPEPNSEHVAEALADPEALWAIREEARRTIVGKYDLTRICLPEQVKLLQMC